MSALLEGWGEFCQPEGEFGRMPCAGVAMWFGRLQGDHSASPRLTVLACHSMTASSHFIRERGMVCKGTAQELNLKTEREEL